MQEPAKITLCKHEPLGKDLTYLSKLYYGVLSKSLQDLTIERYYYTMIVIKEGDGKITQNQLSQKLCSDKVFVVKILDYLTQKGVIRRTINEKDRREHFISLTPKGEKLIPSIASAINTTNELIFKGLTKEEVALYYKTLEIIKSNLIALPYEEVQINFKKSKKSK